MAGDWIKVEQATVDKPEVLRLADLLGWDRRHVLGLLVEFWCWLDKNLSASCPDFVRHMSRKSLDDVLHVQGFAVSLEVIGWAKFDDATSTMHIINARRHNGNTAKTRALDAKRKRETRLENVREMSVSQPDVSRTREEKKRVLTPIVPTSPKFNTFWTAYPSRRRLGKGRCLELWIKKGFEAVGDQICLHVAAMAGTHDWQKEDGKYAPSALTYLNQRRFEDGLPEDPAPRLVV